MFLCSVVFISLFFVLEIAVFHYEQDEKVKEAKAGPLFNEILPFYLEKLDAQAKKNDGHLAVGRVSKLFM